MIRLRIVQAGGVAVAATGVTWLVQQLLAMLGAARLLLPWTIPIVLVALAGLVVRLSLPIRARTLGKRKSRIDPFYAMRVLALARACIITGAVCMGLGGGTLLFLYLLPAGQGNAETWSAWGTVVGGLIAVVGGIIAEQCCKLPPEDDDETASRSKTPVPQA